MKRHAALSLLLLVGLSSGMPAIEESRKEEPEKLVPLKRVAEITDVKYELQTSEPPNLVVTALGNVPSGGWTEVQLIRREYLKEPADGIWEYDLLAKPPQGPSTQAITTVKATDTWEKVDLSRLKGLRVYGLGKGIRTIKLGQ